MASSPFNPGAANPRYLAGRKQEEAALADLLDVGAQGPVGVIFAPRGNGKTALAHWLERAADGRGIDVRYRYARSCSTLEGASALLLDEKLDSHQDFESAVAGYGGPPRLLVVDEAQGLTPPIVSSLVTAAELSQGVLSVVFVGTPHLHQMLHDIDPSLWAKGPVLPLHPLDEASAADALQTPATAAGRPIDESVLEDVVADCHGYPPFLQAWGANLWRQSQADAPIDAAACVRARPIVDFYRFSFYEHRKEELAPYAAPALEVAPSLRGRRHRPRDEHLRCHPPRAAGPSGRGRSCRCVRCLSRSRSLLARAGCHGLLPSGDSEPDGLHPRRSGRGDREGGATLGGKVASQEGHWHRRC